MSYGCVQQRPTWYNIPFLLYIYITGHGSVIFLIHIWGRILASILIEKGNKMGRITFERKSYHDGV